MKQHDVFKSRFHHVQNILIFVKETNPPNRSNKQLKVEKGIMYGDNKMRARQHLEVCSDAAGTCLVIGTI
jgi:hypothetical protein